MRSHKKKKNPTLLNSNGNKCLISNKSSRLCYHVTFCSNTMSKICISSQLCISQGYWNCLTHQSRQLINSVFLLLCALFSQKHSCMCWGEVGEGGEQTREEGACGVHPWGWAGRAVMPTCVPTCTRAESWGLEMVVIYWLALKLWKRSAGSLVCLAVASPPVWNSRVRWRWWMVQKSAQDSLGPTRSFSGELTLNQSETQGMHFPSLESGGVGGSRGGPCSMAWRKGPRSCLVVPAALKASGIPIPSEVPCQMNILYLKVEWAVSTSMDREMSAQVAKWAGGPPHHIWFCESWPRGGKFRSRLLSASLMSQPLILSGWKRAPGGKLFKVLAWPKHLWPKHGFSVKKKSDTVKRHISLSHCVTNVWT